MTSFDSHHLLTLSSGISSHTVRDEMMSPLMYRGTQIPLAFTYRFRGSDNRHAVLFSYDDTELNSSITKSINDVAVSHYINNLHLTFEYSFSTRAAVFENLHTTLFLGARLSSILNLRNHYFQRYDNLMSAEQMTGLGIHLLTETAFQQESDNYLRLEINIPCVSYVLLSRALQCKRQREHLTILILKRTLCGNSLRKATSSPSTDSSRCRLDVSYIFFVSNHIGIDLRYRLQYYSFAQYQDLFHARVLNNQFLLGLTVKL